MRKLVSAPVVTIFYASWCKPCIDTMQALLELAKEAQRRFRIRQVDIEKNPKAAEKYHVTSLPTLVIEKDSVPIKRATGIKTKTQILRMLH